MIHLFRCESCKATYQDVQRDGVLYFHACGPLPPDKDGVQAERPDKRDENVVTDRQRTVTGIKSEGAGVVCLTDARLEEPIWISTLYKNIEAQEEKSNA